METLCVVFKKKRIAGLTGWFLYVSVGWLTWRQCFYGRLASARARIQTRLHARTPLRTCRQILRVFSPRCPLARY
jgi:hypothetical protein